MNERSMKRVGAWAAGRVGTIVGGHTIFGWGFEDVPPDHVRLFTNHACTESFVVDVRPVAIERGLSRG